MNSFQNLKSSINLIDSTNSKWFAQLVHIITKFAEENPSECKDWLNIYIYDQYAQPLLINIHDFIIKAYIRWQKDIENGESSDESLIVIKKMYDMNWHTLYQKQYLSALVDVLHLQLLSICSDFEYSEKKYTEIKDWIKEHLFRFMDLIFGPGHNIKRIIKSELQQVAADLFTKIRVKELFNITRDYPDSYPWLVELKETANASDNLSYIGKTFRETLNKRLLHIGASTNQILDYYISMIKALRVIDPSDSILNYVSVPVRQYLRNRKDAIRCIVTSLIESGRNVDGSSSELHSALRIGGSLEYGVDEDDEEDGPGECWKPRRRDRHLDDFSSNLSTRGMDILAMLVSIYGSTDLFIVEYRSLLADKLLNNLQYHTDGEVATLELLKIRFGEECLHSCEVMIKDVEDSKRINQSIQTELQKKKNHPSSRIDFNIVSDHYWPTFPYDPTPASSDPPYHLHPTLQSQLNDYFQIFHELKKPRKLYPMNKMGSVEIELDFNDGSMRSFLVNPIQANIIQHFSFDDEEEINLSRNKSCSMNELVVATGLEVNEVRQGLLFWVGKGIIREMDQRLQSSSVEDDRWFEIIEEQSNSKLNLNEDQPNAFMDRPYDDSVDDSDESSHFISANAAIQQKSNLVIIEKYTMGLLKNHGSMSIERLSTMLKLIVNGTDGDVKFDMNLGHLRQFLNSLIESGNVEIIDGMYSLLKS